MKGSEQEKIEPHPGMMLKNPSTGETYLLLEIRENYPAEGYGSFFHLLELSTGEHHHRRGGFILHWEVL